MTSRYTPQSSDDFRSYEAEHVRRARATTEGSPIRGTSAIITGFIVIGLLAVGALLVWLSPAQTLTLNIALTTVFLVFMGTYALFSAFTLFHAFRFGFKGDANKLAAIIFIAMSVAGFVIDFFLFF